MIFQFNFSDPTLISQGDTLDKTYVKIKDTSYFKPAALAASFDSTVLTKEVVAIVPKQLPLNIDAEKLQTTIASSQQSVLAILIIQVVAQILLKGSLKLIIDLFLAIQMAVYVLLFNLRLPALAEMVLLEFKNLIEFRMLNIEAVV